MKRLILIVLMMLFMVSGCSSNTISDEELFNTIKQANMLDVIKKLDSVGMSANELNKEAYSIYSDSISSHYTTYTDEDAIKTTEVNIKDYKYGIDEKGDFYTKINLTGNLDRYEELLDMKLNRFEPVKIDKNGVNTVVVTNVKKEFINEFINKYNLGNDVDKIETTFILDKETQRILYRTDVVYYTTENKEKTTTAEYEYRYNEANPEKEMRDAMDLHFEKADAYRLIKVVSDPGATIEQLATFKAPIGDRVDLLMKQGYKIDMEKSTRSDTSNSNDLDFYVVNDANASLVVKQEEKQEEKKEESKTTKENDASGFVLLGEVIPDAIMEIRYYSTYNFVGKRIDGYLEPVAILTKEAAEALKKVSDELVSKGYRLKIYDAYRPSKAVDHFVRWSKDLSDAKMKDYFYPELDKSVLFEQKYILEKSGHSRGSTVDLTLFDMKTEKEVDMGGTFDYFGELSHPDYKDISTEQYANRMLLRETMLKYGFKPLEEEWWHFTLDNEPYPDTYFNFDVSSDSIKNN